MVRFDLRSVYKVLNDDKYSFIAIARPGESRPTEKLKSAL